MEPLPCKNKRNRLDGTKVFVVNLAPTLPERILVRMVMQKAGHFPGVMQNPVVSHNVTQNVQSAKCQVVDGAEGWKAQTGCGASLSALPECLHSRDPDPSRRLIPETVVQIDGRRHLGVVEIAAPLPAAPPGHLWNVVGWVLFQSSIARVSEAFHCCLCGRDHRRRKIEIDIGLHARVEV